MTNPHYIYNFSSPKIQEDVMKIDALCKRTVQNQKENQRRKDYSKETKESWNPLQQTIKELKSR